MMRSSPNNSFGFNKKGGTRFYLRPAPLSVHLFGLVAARAMAVGTIAAAAAFAVALIANHLPYYRADYQHDNAAHYPSSHYAPTLTF